MRLIEFGLLWRQQTEVRRPVVSEACAQNYEFCDSSSAGTRALLDRVLRLRPDESANKTRREITQTGDREPGPLEPVHSCCTRPGITTTIHQWKQAIPSSSPQSPSLSRSLNYRFSSSCSAPSTHTSTVSAYQRPETDIACTYLQIGQTSPGRSILQVRMPARPKVTALPVASV